MNSSSRDDSRLGLFQQKIPCFFLATSHISTVLRQPLFAWHDVIEIKKKKKEEREKREREIQNERTTREDGTSGREIRNFLDELAFIPCYVETYIEIQNSRGHETSLYRYHVINYGMSVSSFCPLFVSAWIPSLVFAVTGSKNACILYLYKRSPYTVEMFIGFKFLISDVAFLS